MKIIGCDLHPRTSQNQSFPSSEIMLGLARKAGIRLSVCVSHTQHPDGSPARQLPTYRGEPPARYLCSEEHPI